MKTNWDYTSLADAYLKRPDYSEHAIKAMLKIADISKGNHACDVGAGVAHLTLQLAKHELKVTAIEPNNAMRKIGIKRTSTLSNILWHEGTGENTGQASGIYNIVTFGSSFNVCNRELALKEAWRLIGDNGWFACMWNHRNLEDEIQAEIEKTIRKRLPSYGYGIRREDQTQTILDCKLYEPVIRVSGDVTHTQSIQNCVKAWRSHATLARQAGSKFTSIVDDIDIFLRANHTDKINIPYTTHIWMAKKK